MYVCNNKSDYMSVTMVPIRIQYSIIDVDLLEHLPV